MQWFNSLLPAVWWPFLFPALEHYDLLSRNTNNNTLIEVSGLRVGVLDHPQSLGSPAKAASPG